MKVVKYIYVDVVKFPDFWKVFDIIYSILFLFSLLGPNLLPRPNVTLPVPLFVFNLLYHCWNPEKLNPSLSTPVTTS